MKRDVDLIRDILLRLEASNDEYTALEVARDLAPEHVLVAHANLLKDSGFTEAGRVYVTWEHTGFDDIYRITSPGYDFLDAIRDDAIWRKTKTGASQLGGWTVKVLADLATGYVRAKAQELGLPLA